jgi:hypothetical protein
LGLGVRDLFDVCLMYVERELGLIQLNSYYTVYQLNSYCMYSKLWAGSIMHMRLNMYKIDKTVYTKKCIKRPV